jgi:hypothetical protein
MLFQNGIHNLNLITLCLSEGMQRISAVVASHSTVIIFTIIIILDSVFIFISPPSCSKDPKELKGLKLSPH